MAARTLLKVLRDHSKQVAKLETATADDFLKALKQTENEIVGRLFAVTDKDTAFSTFQLQRVLAEVKAAIGTLESKANDIYGVAQQDAIDLAIQHASDELYSLSREFDSAPLDLSLDAASGMSDPSQLLLANHFESSVQSYGLDVLNAVRRKIQVGMITGDPSHTVVTDVQKAISGTRSQAEQLVRTETSASYGAARHASITEAAKSIPGAMKQWVHQGSYPCPTCIPLDGTERPIDGTWMIKIGKKTKRVAHPPGHPRCVCALILVKPSWKKKLQGLGYLSRDEE